MRRKPTRPGENGTEIAREAGMSGPEMAALVADGTLSISDIDFRPSGDRY